MKNFLSGILFCVLALNGFAQDEYVDSLRRELVAADKDSTKIIIYGNLFDYYLNIDNDIADSYADTILLYSRKYSVSSYASACVCKGIVKYELGDYVSSAKYYGYAEQLTTYDQDTDLLPIIYTGLGNVYSESGNKKTAYLYFTKAMKEIKKVGDPDSYSAAYVNLADIYYAEKKYDTTLIFLDSAFNMAESDYIKVRIYDYVAQIYSILGNNKKAIGIYEKILSMLDDDTDTYFLVSVINNLTHIQILENEFQKAIENLKIVDSICTVNTYNEIRLSLYQNYHDYYLRIGDYEKSNYYIECYNILRDSVYSIELSEELKNIVENRNMREKTELEMNIREEEIRMLIVVIVLVLAFSAVIAFLLVRKSRMNKMLGKLNSDLKQRDSEISSNLDYAREIQLGCMSNNLMDNNLKMFVLDRPKVVVGGDFYISQTKGDATYVVVGDCTGHGISGGFLSVLGIKSVYAAIEKYGTLPEMASFINNEFCEIVSSAENLKGESLCLSMVRICGNEVRFLGSKQKMWIVSDYKGDCSTARPLACKPEVHEYKSANAIMGSAVNEEFAEEILNVKSGDVVFLSSDGYPDQFGADGKLKYSRFRALLQECSQMAPDKAKEFLSAKLDLWRGDLEQTDDVMVVGMFF